MASQGIEGRWAPGKDSLQQFNVVAKSLLLHFIMHVPWSYVFWNLT